MDSLGVCGHEAAGAVDSSSLRKLIDLSYWNVGGDAPLNCGKLYYMLDDENFNDYTIVWDKELFGKFMRYRWWAVDGSAEIQLMIERVAKLEAKLPKRSGKRAGLLAVRISF